jgi:hypothetical protein
MENKTCFHQPDKDNKTNKNDPPSDMNKILVHRLMTDDWYIQKK